MVFIKIKNKNFFFDKMIFIKIFHTYIIIIKKNNEGCPKTKGSAMNPKQSIQGKYHIQSISHIFSHSPIW